MEYFDQGLPFYKGNLHMHTTASDGVLSPQEAEAVYRDRGYDFIAITDHRRRTADTHWNQRMLVLPGIELDYALGNQLVHLVGIGVGAGIDGDVGRINGPQEGVRRLKAHGAYVILAHPAWSLNTTETLLSLQGLDAAEVYNGVSRPPFSGDRADSTVLLDMAAANGRLLNSVAADDSHWYKGEECSGFIRLQAKELSEQAVMEALRAGRYHASCGPEIHSLRIQGDTLSVTCSPVEHIVILSNMPWTPDRNFHGEGITRAEYRINRNAFWPETFVRVVLIDRDGKKAWSNPIPV